MLHFKMDLLNANVLFKLNQIGPYGTFTIRHITFCFQSGPRAIKSCPPLFYIEILTDLLLTNVLCSGDE